MARTLGDILRRFRPAVAPGPAAPAGVPADRVAEAEAELAVVFAALAPTVAEATRLVEEATTEAERRRHAAHQEAQRMLGGRDRSTRRSAVGDDDRAAGRVGCQPRRARGGGPRRGRAPRARGRGVPSRPCRSRDRPRLGDGRAGAAGACPDRRAARASGPRGGTRRGAGDVSCRVGGGWRAREAAHPHGGSVPPGRAGSRRRAAPRRRSDSSPARRTAGTSTTACRRDEARRAVGVGVPLASAGARGLAAAQRR